MDGADYLAEVTRLSRVSGEKYQALSNFIEKYKKPNGILLVEFDRLRAEYAEAFSEWINFCEDHSGR